jgi:hypothetical protein
MTDTNQSRIKAMRTQLQQVRMTLARYDRMLPVAVAAAGYRGNGYTLKGGYGTGRTSGAVSDPTGRQVAAISDALELGAQLFGTMGYPGTWPMLIEVTATIERQMAALVALMPADAPKPDMCASGTHMDGYGTWGRKDAHGTPTRCDELAEHRYTGLCCACYQRRRRWQRLEVGT